MEFSSLSWQLATRTSCNVRQHRKHLSTHFCNSWAHRCPLLMISYCCDWQLVREKERKKNERKKHAATMWSGKHLAVSPLPNTSIVEPCIISQLSRTGMALMTACYFSLPRTTTEINKLWAYMTLWLVCKESPITDLCRNLAHTSYLPSLLALSSLPPKHRSH